MDLTHLHPMIVHFPIALLIVGFLSDITGLLLKRDSFTKTGFLLLILGAIGTVSALISGDMAGDGVNEQGLLGQALEKHEEAAELTVWLVTIAAASRIILVLLNRYTGYLKISALILFFVSVLAVGRTGYYGGKLVYEHAAGVTLNLGADFNTGIDQQDNVKSHKKDDHDDDDDDD